MKRALSLLLMMCFTFAPLSHARAEEEESDALGREHLLTALEELIGGLEGIALEDLELRKQGELYSVAIPISESARESFLAVGARGSNSRNFKAMACGLQLSDPQSLSTLITAVDARQDSSYVFWFAAMNLGRSDQVRRTTFQRKGPGERFKVVEDLFYEAERLSLFVGDFNSGFGASTVQVKIVGGGKAKSGYFAQ